MTLYGKYASQRPVDSDIVVVLQRALMARDLDRFGLAFFAARGYSTAVIDVGEIVTSRIYHDRTRYDGFFGIDIRVTDDIDAFRRMLPIDGRQRLVICSVGAGYCFPENRAVLHHICAGAAPYLFLMSELSGFFSAQSGHGLMERIWRFNPRDAIKSAYARLPLDWLGLRPADFAVVAGRLNRPRRPLIDATTTLIQAHVHDFDPVLQRKASPEPRDIAVFLDQNFGFHPDAVDLGIKMVTVETFYPSLCRFFERIETATGLRVVVAAHPRANYAGRETLFGGREIVAGRTADLVAESRLAITAYSNATAIAVVEEKPLLFYTCREIRENPRVPDHPGAFAARLGRPLVDIDDARADLVGLLDLDRAPYRRFVEDFIRAPDVPDRPYWNIVHDALCARGVLAPPKAAA